MSLSCQLCNADCGRNPVCSTCVARMRAGEHPIVCLTCRENLGAVYGVYWMPRAQMAPEDVEICDDMEKTSNAIAVYFREHCTDCVKGEMPCVTTSPGAAC